MIQGGKYEGKWKILFKNEGEIYQLARKLMYNIRIPSILPPSLKKLVKLAMWKSDSIVQ